MRDCFFPRRWTRRDCFIHAARAAVFPAAGTIMPANLFAAVGISECDFASLAGFRRVLAQDWGTAERPTRRLTDRKPD